MSNLAYEVELVVREVLAQLAAAPEPQKPKCAAPSPSTPCKEPVVAKSEPAPADQPNTLSVAARVVTMNDVFGRLDSIRRLVVSRQSVVTPAVRDELLRRGIALEHADSPNDRPAPVRLTLITTGTDFDPTSLVAALAREGFQVERSALDCLIASVDALAAEVSKHDTLGVLITSHAAAGLCLANRLAGVRAVAGADAPAIAAASAAVGANLLIANPRTGSFFQLKQAITEFARAGVRSCPEVFRKKLA